MRVYDKKPEGVESIRYSYYPSSPCNAADVGQFIDEFCGVTLLNEAAGHAIVLSFTNGKTVTVKPGQWVTNEPEKYDPETPWWIVISGASIGILVWVLIFYCVYKLFYFIFN